ncbi:MAG TPA: sigma-70 family RNA polymerase sigma factor [Pseudonocardiaceae bacterium]|nr:sigma-70 family RNA polymerase sigma factor [Pseudonocardiaceae bacterium]
MDERDALAARFEEHRSRLRGVAYRMLGSLAEADDAVQETWLRFSGADSSQVDNLGAWLTTIVGRVSLNMLRSRNQRREDPIGAHVPDFILASPDADPEQDAVLADSISIALLIVLETLNPTERLAFVLHDLFAMPFEEIGPIVGRNPAAARQLASRARRRVQGASSHTPDAGLAEQRRVVEAFTAAARGGDLTALIEVLDPDVVVRTDWGPGKPGTILRGRDAVAQGAMEFSRLGAHNVDAIINGAPAAVAMLDGKPISIAVFNVAGGKIAGLDILADPERIAALDLTVLD